MSPVFFMGQKYYDTQTAKVYRAKQKHLGDIFENRIWDVDGAACDGR